MSSNAKARRPRSWCWSAPAGNLVLMMTDVQLAGNMDGVELAHIARKYNPEMGVIVTSGRPLHQELPDGVQFWAKPWAPLDVIREAERMVHERRRDDEAPPRFVSSRARPASPPDAAVLMAGHDAVVSVDLADRGRFPRHRRALYAGGGADLRRAAERRGGVRLHARHRAAYAGRHAGTWPRCCTPARWRSPR